MSVISVALLQMADCGDDQAANTAKGESYCRRASEMGADNALFPEMWSIGYTLPDPAQADGLAAWRAKAIGKDSPFVSHFRSLARELDMAIAVTYLERWDGPPRNAVSLIDRRGEIAMTYAKVHTCDFDREVLLTPGDEFSVCALDTREGIVQAGAMICYDREFPESARVLMLKGAELILTPNACKLEANRLGQFRARAYENMVGVAMANYAAPRCNCRSVAFDGMGFDPDGKSRDMRIVQAGEDEGVYLAAFDMAEIRAYRERETWGNAYRKPGTYGPLTSLEVRHPFNRPETR